MSQSAFTAAILDADASVPPGLTDPEGRAAPRRFAVYRNNVAASLTEALEQGFPALQTLIGPRRFKALAGLYLRAHPPADPRMMYFGAALPDFLTDFAPLSAYPYLPDVARLELAMRESYHAADAAPLATESLTSLTEAALHRARLRFAPATRLLASPYPVHAIWQSTMGGPKPQPGAAHLLITRPEYDPVTHPLSADDFALLTRLLQGAPLGTAVTQTGAGTDIAALLGLLLASASLTQIEIL